MNYQNSKPKVLVTRPDFSKIGIDLLHKNCDVLMMKEACEMPRVELLKHVAGVDAIFCTPINKIDKELLDTAGSQLKVISTHSVGYDHIDVLECRKRGIRIGYTPNVLTDATAEITMALLLATTRRIIEANREVYNGGWSTWSPNWMCGPGIKGNTIGIFGFGRIGLEVARRCVPFKPKEIIYTNRSGIKSEASDVNARYVEFEELLKLSDILIICCALTPETTGIFNEEAFRRMKKSAILINTARGTIVDQKALYNALKHGGIYAAGLDVTTPEPLPLTDPLLKLPNCVILPHIGSANTTTREEMCKVSAENILLGLQGKEMIYELK